MTGAEYILIAGSVYVAAGVAVAVPFVFLGVGKVDPAASRARWPFRLTILPGVAVLWPIMLSKWIRARSSAEESHT